VFLAVMAAAGFYVFNQTVAGGGYVTVPDIVNKPIIDASFLIQDRELVIGRQEARVSADVPEGRVISQIPAAGVVVRKGRKVFPTVSRGPDLRTAPNLLNELFEPALDRIEKSASGLRVGTVARIAHEAEADTVLAQDPAPGRPVAESGQIHLLVSAGPALSSLYMPSLVGKTVTEALNELSPLGLKVGLIQLDRLDAPLNVVMDQRPESGAMVVRGDQVMFSARASESTLRFWHRTHASAAKVQSWRRMEFVAPPADQDLAVRIVLIKGDGTREIRFPQPQHYVGGRPPHVAPGTKIIIHFPVEDEATVEIYVDGRQYRTVYYRAGEEPLVTEHGRNTGEYRFGVTDATLPQPVIQ
jgi:beta-lactam-binding protein with PASTA domain